MNLKGAITMSESDISHSLQKGYKDKIAFQEDADRPRVDRVSQHALRGRWGGALLRGVPGPGGVCLLPGGVHGPRGVSALGEGVSARGCTWSRGGGGSAPGGVPGQVLPPPVDRQTPVNLLPCLKLRLRVVKIRLVFVLSSDKRSKTISLFAFALAH